MLERWPRLAALTVTFAVVLAFLSAVVVMAVMVVKGLVDKLRRRNGNNNANDNDRSD
jgi:hypothetical protein